MTSPSRADGSADACGFVDMSAGSSTTSISTRTIWSPRPNAIWRAALFACSATASARPDRGTGGAMENSTRKASSRFLMRPKSRFASSPTQSRATIQSLATRVDSTAPARLPRPAAAMSKGQTSMSEPRIAAPLNGTNAATCASSAAGGGKDPPDGGWDRLALRSMPRSLNKASADRSRMSSSTSAKQDFISPPRASNASEFAHERDQQIGLERLDHPAPRARALGLPNELRVALRGQDHDRERRPPLFALDLREHLEPAHLRHVDVGHHDGEIVAVADLVQAVHPVGGVQDLEPRRLEGGAHLLPGAQRVVDHEHLLAHVVCLPARRRPAGRAPRQQTSL